MPYSLGRRPDSYPKCPPAKYNLWHKVLSVLPEPSNVSYASWAPVALNQEQTGSCTCHSAADIVMADSLKHGHYIDPSPLAWYVQAEQNYPPPGDNGLESGDPLVCYNKYGWIPRSEFPMPPSGTLTDFNPPKKSLWITNFEKLKQFASINPDVASIKMALRVHGPVTVGMMVANSFVGGPLNKDGSMPAPDSEAGGHELSIFLYNNNIKLHDDTTGKDSVGGFGVLNSWGKEWGISMPGSKSGGWFWLPYSIWTDYPQYAPTDAYTITVQ